MQVLYALCRVRLDSELVAWLPNFLRVKLGIKIEADISVYVTIGYFILYASNFLYAKRHFNDDEMFVLPAGGGKVAIYIFFWAPLLIWTLSLYLLMSRF